MKFKGNQLRKFKRKETLQEIFLFCTDLYILTKFFYNKHVLYHKEKVRAVLEKNPLLQKQISYCLKSTPLTHYTRPRMVWPGRGCFVRLEPIPPSTANSILGLSTRESLLLTLGVGPSLVPPVSSFQPPGHPNGSEAKTRQIQIQSILKKG